MTTGQTDLRGHAFDVAIVGAGAAGIAAARHLQAARPDLSLIVLEALDRAGGRAFAIAPAQLGGAAIDLGCGWLHGARTNEWTRIAREIGLIVDETPAPWSEGGRQLDGDRKWEQAARRAIADFFDRADERGESLPDAPLADLLEPGNPWNGRIGAVATYVNGVELDRASIHDLSRYDPGPGPDWRVREGYGTLVARYAASLPLRLGTIVRRIDHRAKDHIRLETSGGTIRARAVIVTVGTNVLAAEGLRFDPPLPQKTEAANRLPLGLANKAFLLVRDADDLPVDTRAPGRAKTAAGSYFLRPFGLPVIEAYFGGAFARELEMAGGDAALAAAAEELADHFGSAFRGRLTLLAMSAWAGMPHIHGSYSYAQPGAADQRAVLAAPVDGRLFFAGEATSPAKFSTAHGAYESGVAAAAAAIAPAAPPRGPATA